MISNIIRKLLSLLSSWYPNKEISKKRDNYLRNLILSKIDKIKVNKNNLQKTHKNFNIQLLKLLKDPEIKNFLRKSFIQKMFFLHNRLFIYKELREIKKSKNWKLYKKILEEDNIGNPIRYFLYLNSSGNRINHVFHLYILEKELKIDLKKDIKKIFEFGAGYGCMARIFSKINTKIKYTCFDTHYVNLLQYYYLSHNNLDVGFSKEKKYFLTSNLKSSNDKSDLFIANWSLSETPANFRKKFTPQISKCKYILISFQEKFENINNFKYFKNLKSKLKNKFEIKILKNPFYNGNLFVKQNHYFLIGKKL
tara:strand:- start:9864 stop:10790 length:927 start_codon:yes stop_codon:yes gene_type:complete